MKLNWLDKIKLKNGKTGVLFFEHDDNIELLMDLSDQETEKYSVNDIEKVYPYKPLPGCDDRTFIINQWSNKRKI